MNPHPVSSRTGCAVQRVCQFSSAQADDVTREGHQACSGPQRGEFWENLEGILTAPRFWKSAQASRSIGVFQSVLSIRHRPLAHPLRLSACFELLRSFKEPAQSFHVGLRGQDHTLDNPQTGGLFPIMGEG